MCALVPYRSTTGSRCRSGVLTIPFVNGIGAVRAGRCRDCREPGRQLVFAKEEGLRRDGLERPPAVLLELGELIVPHEQTGVVRGAATEHLRAIRHQRGLVRIPLVTLRKIAWVEQLLRPVARWPVVRPCFDETD